MAKWRNLTLFSLLLLIIMPSTAITLALEDAEILIQTKASAHLTDPTGRLADWTRSNSPCNWTGIACDPLTNAVDSIDLSWFQIAGEFPAGFCRIPTLKTLSLAGNFINGTLDPAEFALCSRLRSLNLSSNCFVGELPEFAAEFRELAALDLSQNNFSGEIPAGFGRFPRLSVLNLYGNFLTGKIPPFLGNLIELTEFNLAFNWYTPGPLPPEIGNLTKLEILWLAFSNLIGEIPDSIGRLTRLRILDLSHNMLTGRIPESTGNLGSVYQIELFRNRLHGELPESIGNLSTLRQFDASENSLTGKLPEKLAGLHLTSLGLNDNFFDGEIPAVLALNPNLAVLKLFNNSFSGEIPPALGRYSDLEEFDVSTNRLVGKLPPNLCQRGSLRTMIAFDNKISGTLPSSLGDCDTLTYVRIENNELSGRVPDRFWSLSKLYYLEIRKNRFNGTVPPAISGARNLTQLLISDNDFSGEIPPAICHLPELTVIDASRNRFSGDLPPCIADLSKLEQLDLEENEFSGTIPSGYWTDLTELNLSNNKFSGEIPSDLGKLPVLTYLDLSENQLSGDIPADLTNLNLNILNLSGNHLTGKIPAGFDSPFYLRSLVGNPNLCSAADLGPIPPCSTENLKPVGRTARTAYLITALLLVFALILLSVLFFLHKNRSGRLGKKKPGPWKLTSFHRVGFNEAEIFECLTDDNLIGSGGSGRVYKASLKSGQTVAVKRLWTGPRGPDSDRDFRSEVETLARVRHGNIVKLLFCCAAEDFRVLVYEYMENGSLGEVLHGEKGGSLLDWERRVRIALGAAQGLAYLHHDCAPAIVHRDVKPNNILLDGEFCAHVGDFGLARAMACGGEEQRVMSIVAGSCGYIAPEYAYTLKVNEKSDVYSFGVVLLELVTGKKALDHSFGENKDIVRWVTDSIASMPSKEGSKDAVLDLQFLMDPRLHPSSHEYEEMVRVLHVGILCTSAFPMNRPSMRRVVELLRDRRNVSVLVPAYRKQ